MAEQGVTEDMYAHVAEHRDHDEYSNAERVAIEYAERFALEHLALDDDFFVRLREYFKTPTSWISRSASRTSWHSGGSPRC